MYLLWSIVTYVWISCRYCISVVVLDGVQHNGESKGLRDSGLLVPCSIYGIVLTNDFQRFDPSDSLSHLIDELAVSRRRVDKRRISRPSTGKKLRCNFFPSERVKI
ncbi:hypothetical protein B0H12DRAFT_57535 [Mycena haematopus]|nr:hypothetical protein B0H12DRAFT_57535 [Mycena haematopus]